MKGAKAAKKTKLKKMDGVVASVEKNAAYEIDMSKYTPLSNLEVKNILKSRGLNDAARNQILLEGKVAPQPDWALIANDGFSRNGGAWQVITDGGEYNGAIRR